MNWTELINRFEELGFGLPDDPTDVLCVEIGIAQWNGTLDETRATALVNLQPAASRVWRLRAIQALG